MASEKMKMDKSSLPDGVPPEAGDFLEEMGYFDADRLQLGQQVPVLELRSLENKFAVVIGAPDAARPVVLVFGSYT